MEDQELGTKAASISSPAAVCPVDLNDAPRIFVEVLTSSGRPDSVTLRLGPDTVEVWFQARCCGVFNRVAVRSWLAGDRQRLSAGEVVFTLDPRSDGERVVISLEDVIAWTISPNELAAIREQV